MIVYTCPKCNKTGERNERCPKCDTWMLAREISSARLKEQHDRSYEVMRQEHGKEMANKQWRPLNR